MLSRFRYGALLAVALATGAVAACQMLLGDYETWKAGKECSEDTDCGENEGCDDSDYGSDAVCRVKCSDSADCVASVGFGSSCGLYDMCSDPLGAPCDPDESSACGSYGGKCTTKDSKNNAVRGYCSASCTESDAGTSDCPQDHVHYLCDESKCLCIGDWCEEQFERVLGDLPSGSGD